MTATNFIILPDYKSMYVVTDAASYDSRGIVTGLASKVRSIPQWPGVVTGRGHSIILTLVGEHVSNTFLTFDDAIEGIAGTLPSALSRHPWLPENAAAEVIIAGWSIKNDRHEAYVLATAQQELKGLTQQEADELVASGRGINPDVMKLQKLPEFVWGPLLVVDWLFTTGYKFNENPTPAETIKDLRRIIELQRHDPAYPHRVGGWAELTIVTKTDITQSILHRWPEDEVGFVIEPDPIKDWPAFLAAA